MVRRVPKGSCLGSQLFLLYVTDLPLASNFNATLFVTNTLLMLSDKNFKELEKKVNEQILSIDVWLRKNKLSLDYSKTRFMIMKTDPATQIEFDFSTYVNN